MINKYIIFLGISIAIIEIIISLKPIKNKDKKGSILFFHGLSIIFIVTLLSSIKSFKNKENILLYIYCFLFYIVTLILLCKIRIKEKKSSLYQKEQERISNWK